MPFQSNKRLPLSPADAATFDQHYVVSPIDEVRYQPSTQSRTETLHHDSSDCLQDGSDKNSFMVPETVSASPKWQPPPISKTRSGSHWWPWEWLCELLAVGSLGAMYFVLWYYQDRPQADWQQSYFTLNGFIALLATLTKTGLIIPVSAAIGQRKWLRFLPNRKGNDRARRIGDFEAFDEASRGSLGSAKLIISLNAWDVACLGALITIVSVFFNAITQNVLSTYQVTRDGNAFGQKAGVVPRSVFYNRTSSPRTTPEISFYSEFAADIDSLASIYNGIISETIDDVPISCATGNCTWPIIPTLGVCGACVDMRPHLEQSCSGSTDSDSCWFSIPGGMNLTKPRSLPSIGITPVFVAGIGSGYIFNRSDIVGKHRDGFKEKLSYNFIGQSYSEFVGANEGSWPPSNRTIFNRENVLAYECGIWHCMQARSVNASNGVVHDTMLDFRIERKEDPDSDTGSWYYAEEPAFNFDGFRSDNEPTSGWADLRRVEKVSDRVLTGSVTISTSHEVTYTPEVNSYNTESVGNYHDVRDLGADCIHAAWMYADDFDKWWARLTKSMTNNIRLNGILITEEPDRYRGISWMEVTYTKVRWLWLIFPTALVLLSMVFLVATMVASWHSGLKPWKSFVLPVLYTRLEDGLQEEWRQEYAQGTSLLSEVKGRWVGLDNNDDAWVFRHVAKDCEKARGVRFAGDTSVDG